MESTDHAERYLPLSPEAAEEMAKYHITRIPVDYFHCGGFRYTNLQDAIAQAKRQQKLNEPIPTVAVDNVG